MSRHLTKTNYGQCKCLWCGRWRQTFEPCWPDDVKDALAKWAGDNGRTWKSKLLSAWSKGEDVGQQLQWLKGACSPSTLLKLPTRILRRRLEQSK